MGEQVSACSARGIGPGCVCPACNTFIILTLHPIMWISGCRMYNFTAFWALTAPFNLVFLLLAMATRRLNHRRFMLLVLLIAGGAATSAALRQYERQVSALLHIAAAHAGGCTHSVLEPTARGLQSGLWLAVARGILWAHRGHIGGPTLL